MQIDYKKVKKCFEKSMADYDENAVVQKFLAEKLVKQLCCFRMNFGKVLELGSGTGFLTKEILSHCKFDEYIANDLTERSKFYLDKILNKYDFVLGNAEKIKPGTNFDLIVSNAMFQWFSDLRSVVNTYSTFLKEDGILAFTTFSRENFFEIKDLTGLSLSYKSLDEIKAILSENYKILYAEESEYLLRFNTPLELLAHMKHTGVNSLDTKNWTVTDIKNFCEKYRKKYPEISLTYSPVVIIVQKK